jgi:hypothetical protein
MLKEKTKKKNQLHKRIQEKNLIKRMRVEVKNKLIRG